MAIDLERFHQTIAHFDTLNARDPNMVTIDGKKEPKELVYAARLSEMLNRYAPDASEALQLAARAQHIQRWTVPRSDFPMTKPGYMQWRGKLKRFHADVASKVMAEHGYDSEMIQQVSSLLKKENLRTNPETQMLEDIIVLAFLEHDLESFVEKYHDYSEEKFISILRKSYLKMSAKGQQAALSLIHIPEHLLPVVQKAVA